MLKNEIIKFSSFIFNIISKLLKNISFLVMIGVGPKDMGTPAHLISSPRPTPRRKKCLMTNEGNPDRQIVGHPRQAKITGEKSATSPEAIPSRIAKEIPSPMG